MAPRPTPSGVGDTINEVAEDIGNDATRIAGAMDSELQNAARSVGNFAEDVGESIASVDFGEIGDMYKSDLMSAKEDLMRITGMAADACAKVLPLLRLEIFRDFSQIMSVVFGAAYTTVTGLMKDAKKWLGGIASIIAIDLGEAFRSDTAVLIGVILAIAFAFLTLASFIWMVCFSGISKMKMNSVRTGHETVEFSDVAAQRAWTIFFVNATLLVALSVYLPLTQISFQVIFCEKSSFFMTYLLGANPECKSGNSTYLIMQIAAYVVLLWFTLGLPFFLRKQILLHMPVGSPRDPEWTFDVDGLKVKFDNRIYNELVENDLQQIANPFRSLYRGYEKEHSMWKIFVLIFKLLLTLVITILTSNKVSELTIAWVTFGFMIFMFVYNYYASPFVEPMNDTMDTSGRFTTVIAAFAGVINLASGSDTKIAAVFGFIVMFSGIVNMFVMGAIMFSGVVWFRAFMKNTFGLFSFYDSCRNLGDLSAVSAISTWQVEREVKHRVWQSFWSNILSNQCGDDASKRLVQLQKDAVDYGYDLIENHWAALNDPVVMENRNFIRENLEGVDLYWDDPSATRDGHLDSKTNFGKMYVMAYPYHCVIVYDDCEDETFLETNEACAKFRQKQEEPAVKKKVFHRQVIRALASQPKPILNPFTRWETRTVADGTDTTTDSKGNKHTKTHYSTIQIEMHYTKGNITLKVNNELSYAAGFDASQVYHDGHGSARKPRTGQMYTESNTTTSMPITHIGFKDLFSFEVDDARWNGFIANVARSEVNLEAEMNDLLRLNAEYRTKLATDFETKRHILANAFWYYVYNDATKIRSELDKYLREVETNEFLRKFADDNAAGLDFLYKRMNFIDQDDAHRLWYVFWEDFYIQNKGCTIVKKHAALFDPSKSASICYKHMKREVLEQWLRNIDLQSSCFKTYFDKKTLDVLYDRLENPDNFPVDEYKSDTTKKMDKFLGKTAVQNHLSRMSILQANPSSPDPSAMGPGRSRPNQPMQAVKPTNDLNNIMSNDWK